VFNAAAYKSSKCRGFVGYGDAHLGNVSPLIFNRAEMRMVETRAINRALSKAYGEALCSLEGLLAWPLSPEQIPVLRHALQCRPPFQKGVLNAARTNPARSRQLVDALCFCGLGSKNPEENSILRCISEVWDRSEARQMARRAAGGMGWKSGGADGEGHWNVQPGCTLEECDHGRDADIDRKPT